MPTATLPPFRVESANWRRHGRALRQIRATALTSKLGDEQAQEGDRADGNAHHLLAQAGEPPAPVGGLRWRPSGQIEHLAVLPQWRGQGIGAALLASAVREMGAGRRLTPFLFTTRNTEAFFARLGFAPDDEPFSRHGEWLRHMTLTTPDALREADLRSRQLGTTGGRLFLPQHEHLALAACQLAAQSRRRIELLSVDLQPEIYDRQSFAEALRYLALELRGRLPVRILVIDPEPSLRRGHRVIELARKLTSDIQIRLVPKDWAEHSDQFLLCDQAGLLLIRHQDPNRTLVDFNSPAETRRLRGLFDQIWDQGETHPGLRRLYL